MLANRFLALATFLGINDLELNTTEANVIVTMLALADGRQTEETLGIP
jgi:prophage maintenance system killer protein